jgi:hypothetical protein
MNVQKCIYCGSSGPFSEEHAIPMLLGEFKGFPPLTNRVCTKCNEDIGRLEEQFGRSGPEAFFRKYLNIEGRDTHDKVNPFERGSAGAKPIDFIACPLGEDIEILWEFNPGERTVREVRQIVFIDDKGKSYPFRIPSWINNIDQLREEMKKFGLPPPGEKISARVFAPDDEKERVENLVKGLGSDFKWLPPQPSAIISNPVIKVQVTDFYFRAIAKIGFHYFLSVFNTFYGNESYFSDIRKFIKEGGLIKNFVIEEKKPILNFPQNYRPKSWGHVLLAESYEGKFRTRLQFFLGPQYDPPTYLVILTNCKLPIVLPTWQTGGIGYYFRYFESGKQGKYSGEVSRLQSLRLL